MQIAVVGGGINGLCSAWQLALAGHQVTLFERDQLMQATSAASSKLLHGGLRYLEQGEFRLVREALQERRWWLKKAPQLTRRLPILYPLYQDSQRARWQLKIGLWLYDSFAGKKTYRPASLVNGGADATLLTAAKSRRFIGCLFVF